MDSDSDDDRSGENDSDDDDDDDDFRFTLEELMEKHIKRQDVNRLLFTMAQPE